jgi:ribosomal protein L37AE/L43A
MSSSSPMLETCEHDLVFVKFLPETVNTPRRHVRVWTCGKCGKSYDNDSPGNSLREYTGSLAR